MARRRRLHTRYKRNPSSSPAPRRNPPLLSEIGEFILPGFGGFAATRFLSRMAATQAAKYKVNLGKHAGVVTSVSSFLAAWFLAHKVSWLAKYQQPIVVGAGLATLQTVLELYFPKIGWMVSDATPALDEAAAGAGSAATQQVVTAPNGRQYRMDDLRPVDDDPNEFTYDDSYDAGRMSREPNHGGGGSEDLLADLMTAFPKRLGFSGVGYDGDDLCSAEHERRREPPMSYHRKNGRALVRRPMGGDMAHGPSWYTAMSGVQSRPVGRRISRGGITDLGSLGDDTLSKPTVGETSPIAQATLEWQQKVLDALNRGADTLTMQRWLQIAATLSIPLAAAVWKAIWPSLGKRFRALSETEM